MASQNEERKRERNEKAASARNDEAAQWRGEEYWRENESQCYYSSMVMAKIIEKAEKWQSENEEKRKALNIVYENGINIHRRRKCNQWRA